MNITLSSKKGKLLLFIVVTNMCNASPGCKASTCKLSTNINTCSFKVGHISHYTVLPCTPVIERLAYSCINETNCSECALNVPGTSFCGFDTFVKGVITK